MRKGPEQGETTGARRRKTARSVPHDRKRAADLPPGGSCIIKQYFTAVPGVKRDEMKTRRARKRGNSPKTRFAALRLPFQAAGKRRHEASPIIVPCFEEEF